MGNSYTEEDKRSFRLKDLLNSKQSSLKAASIVNEGNNTITVKEILEQAQGYFEWLTAEQNFSDLNNPPEKESSPKKEFIPAPTLEQKKVLDYIAEQLKVELNDKLKKEVLNWVEKKYNKKGLYPTKIETAKLFIGEN